MARTPEINAFLNDLKTNHPEDYTAFTTANNNLIATLNKGSPMLHVAELMENKAAFERVVDKYGAAPLQHSVAVSQLKAQGTALGNKLMTMQDVSTDIVALKELNAEPAKDAALIAAEAEKAKLEEAERKRIADANAQASMPQDLGQFIMQLIAAIFTGGDFKQMFAGFFGGETEQQNPTTPPAPGATTTPAVVSAPPAPAAAPAATAPTPAATAPATPPAPAVTALSPEAAAAAQAAAGGLSAPVDAKTAKVTLQAPANTQQRIG